MTDQFPQHRFPKADEDISTARHVPDTPQTRAPTYRLAFADPEFLLRDELRPVRLQLELLKPELALNAAGIVSTIVMFGGARIPAPEDSHKARTKTLAELSYYYAQAEEFARLCTLESLKSGCKENVIISGGGPGVMEAGCRGAERAGGKNISLNIVLPHEQAPNLHATPEFCFNFHYFAIRKMHFLMRAKAITAFPGGFGTLDELFETLTLVQTGRMKPLPILLFGRSFWERVVNWQALAEAGTISDHDLSLFHYVDTAEEAFAFIRDWQPPT
ncbi:LOG family protein [Halovulum dunhuangense]|uniref:AMP nucleosidase n=1 Tax=Halovulum dunhuangense TaxID=1505036 RepID=A0A849L661_9RHOB|nr:LOG family protein [Halovulum dunhuangense]NNU81587.1 LOG family protein [Halovulum dunhuangense]